MTDIVIDNRSTVSRRVCIADLTDTDFERLTLPERPQRPPVSPLASGATFSFDTIDAAPTALSSTLGFRPLAGVKNVPACFLSAT